MPDLGNFVNGPDLRRVSDLGLLFQHGRPGQAKTKPSNRLLIRQPFAGCVGRLGHGPDRESGPLPGSSRLKPRLPPVKRPLPQSPSPSQIADCAMSITSFRIVLTPCLSTRKLAGFWGFPPAVAPARLFPGVPGRGVAPAVSVASHQFTVSGGWASRLASTWPSADTRM